MSRTLPFLNTEMTTEERNAILLASDAELLSACAVDAYRASGPGGQKRNKTSSAVRIRHLSTGLAAISEESRSQHENKARALRRLRLTCALSLRVPVEDVEAVASQVARYCDRQQRLRISAKNNAFGVLVAQVLDLLAEYRGQLRETAAALRISSGQLTRFFSIEPKVMVAVNQIRQANGLSPLRSN